MSDLYSDVLLDHFRLPRNKGTLEDATLTVEGKNPLCGDEMILHLRVENGRIADIRFEGSGCAISMASASMLTEDLKGRTLEEVDARIEQFRSFIRDGNPPVGEEMGDMLALSGIAKLPVRVKCATLPWTTIEEARRRMK